MMGLYPAKTEYFRPFGEVEGVIHIGAHLGEELPWYLHRGMRPVVAVEPQPQMMAQLIEEFVPQGVVCLQFAVGAENGELTIHVPTHAHDRAQFDTMGASRYRPLKGSMIDDERFDAARAVLARQVTLDTLMAECLTTGDRERINCLVVDVQGMELEVLRGAERSLTQMDFLNIECSESPLYDGEAPAEEVLAFLVERGFRPINEITPHDDVLLVRSGLL